MSRKRRTKHDPNQLPLNLKPQEVTNHTSNLHGYSDYPTMKSKTTEQKSSNNFRNKKWLLFFLTTPLLIFFIENQNCKKQLRACNTLEEVFPEEIPKQVKSYFPESTRGLMSTKRTRR